jgi:uncharacterized membrane protein YtjA (UPF0391 family)
MAAKAVKFVIQKSETFTRRAFYMLRYAIIFFVVAIIAAIFGFSGIAGEAEIVAKIFFFIFIVLFVLSLLGGRSRS